MNKAHLVEAIADKLGGREQAAEALDAVLDAIVRAVVAGERVSVTGFGSFEKVHRSARYARNPQTGERVRVKKIAVPRFRAGRGFKDLVSGSKKLPRRGEISVKKAPKGSLQAVAARKAAAKKAPKASLRAPVKKKAAAKKAPKGSLQTGARKKAAAKTKASLQATPRPKRKAPAKKATGQEAPQGSPALQA
ncbi:HU family DNA-binding protein [Streptomyces sp. NPDC004647]|uniref:HU family DNA-binding protein n=1 Tax=Streptomyces sp. NPDC004647 TaxID=3154671 RepID=UPI0033B51485